MAGARSGSDALIWYAAYGSNLLAERFSVYLSGGTPRPGVAPSPAYLRTLAQGLREAHGWPVHRVADYLARAPGAAGTWDPAAIAALLR
jgi:hypothetical protein